MTPKLTPTEVFSAMKNCLEPEEFDAWLKKKKDKAALKKNPPKPDESDVEVEKMMTRLKAPEGPF